MIWIMTFPHLKNSFQINDCCKSETLGILLQAKSLGFIDEIRPFMDKLKTEARFFIAQLLYNRILQLAKED